MFWTSELYGNDAAFDAHGGSDTMATAAPIEQRDELAARLFEAIDSGDVDRFAAMMARDVTVYGDGGGKAPHPLRRPA